MHYIIAIANIINIAAKITILTVLRPLSFIPSYILKQRKKRG